MHRTFGKRRERNSFLFLSHSTEQCSNTLRYVVPFSLGAHSLLVPSKKVGKRRGEVSCTGRGSKSRNGGTNKAEERSKETEGGDPLQGTRLGLPGGRIRFVLERVRIVCCAGLSRAPIDAFLCHYNLDFFPVESVLAMWVSRSTTRLE